MSDAPQSHPGRVARALLAVSASLALLVGFGVTSSALRWVQLRDVGVVEGPLDPITPSVAGGSPSPAPPTGHCAERPCNYLILGSDSRAGLTAEEQEKFGTDDQIGGENRADTVMLVHTDPAAQEAVILSFPRDLWVEIPGQGWGKINSAFEGGISGGVGPRLMAQTVANLTGLTIDHFLYVDLAGFQRIVDTLGGVEMCPPGYQADPATGRIHDPLTALDIEPGCQTFDGQKALAYVRTRDLPCDNIPDFSRIGRQQQFLRAVINQMLRPEQIVRAPGLVEPVVGSLKRDRGLLPGDLVYLVGQMRGIATGAVAFRAVPGSGGWEGSLSVVHMDPQAEELFRAIQEGRPLSDVGTDLLNTPPSPANIEVAVIDIASGAKAVDALTVLENSGFDVTPGIWSAAKSPEGVRGPAIVFRPDQDAAASVLAGYFPGVKLVETDALKGVGVALVMTPDYRPAPVSGGEAPACPTA
jgi:LCP family protein required for cell wall assembly